jgi:hypothetical protein
MPFKGQGKPLAASQMINLYPAGSTIQQMLFNFEFRPRVQI